MATRTKKEISTKASCCGCLVFVFLVLLVTGLYLAARKWAPNHLNPLLESGRSKITAKAPFLDRVLPHAAATTKPLPSVFEPPVASTPQPTQPPTTPSAASTPSAAPTPNAVPTSTPTASVEPGTVTERVVGTGAEATVGHSVVVKYNKTTDAPKIFMLGAGEVDAALDQGVRGMKVGGKRRIGEIDVTLEKVL